MGVRWACGPVAPGQDDKIPGLFSGETTVMRAIGKLLLGAALKNRPFDGRGVVGSAASKASAKTV